MTKAGLARITEGTDRSVSKTDVFTSTFNRTTTEDNVDDKMSINLFE